MATDYSALTLSEIEMELAAIARDARAVFGALDGGQLNWKPDAGRWSVGQCFDHLLNANAEMRRSMDAAMDPSAPRTVWQRLPLLSGLYGRIMIRSLTPEVKRRFTAPRTAQPAASVVDADIVDRFAAAQQDAAARVRALAARSPDRVIMVSPFVSFIVYSVLDGWRIIATHQRRHFEQARRVMQDPGFPAPRDSRAGVH